MVGETRPPIKDNSTCLTFDSVVTNRLGQVHREFVTFKGGAAYPEYIIKFKYTEPSEDEASEDEASEDEPIRVVWAKVRGLPWWPGKVMPWASLRDDTQAALRSKYLTTTGDAVMFFPSDKPTYGYIDSDNLVEFDEGCRLGYRNQKGKGTGVQFRSACSEARDLWIEQEGDEP